MLNTSHCYSLTIDSREKRASNEEEKNPKKQNRKKWKRATWWKLLFAWDQPEKNRWRSRGGIVDGGMVDTVEDAVVEGGRGWMSCTHARVLRGPTAQLLPSPEKKHKKHKNREETLKNVSKSNQLIDQPRRCRHLSNTTSSHPINVFVCLFLFSSFFLFLIYVSYHTIVSNWKIKMMDERPKRTRASILDTPDIASINYPRLNIIID